MTHVDTQPQLHVTGKSSGPILVASHERSGTHLFMDTLRRQFRACRGRAGRFTNPHDSLYFSIDRMNAGHHRPGTPAQCERVLRAIERPCLKTHNTPGMERTLPQYKAFIDALVGRSTRCYCYRDGRKVMASLQCYRQVFDPTTSASLGAFIREDHGDGRSRVRAWADHVRTWLAEPDVVAVRFEDTTKKTRQQIELLAEALQLEPEWVEPLLPKPTKSKLEHWWSRLTGRDESTNIIGRRNGSKPVKWQEALSRDDRAYFEEQSQGLLTELGYETSSNWIDEGGRT